MLRVDYYFLKSNQLVKKSASEKKIQSFKSEQYRLFVQKHGILYPVNYQISYFELRKVLKNNIKETLKNERKDLLKDKELLGRYIKSKFNINVLPVQKYKATVFLSLMSIMRNGSSIDRPSSEAEELKGVMLGSSIIEVADRGSLMDITINLNHTLRKITDDIKKLLISSRTHFKSKRTRLDDDEKHLEIFHLKKVEGRSWREIMRTQKSNASDDINRLRQLKRHYTKAKSLINDVLTK